MLGTYAAAAFLIVVSVPLGAGILALCGARRFSWLAATVGLAAATVLAWWLVRLPGEGITALAGLLTVSALSGVFAAARLEGIATQLRRGAPAAAVAALAASIPFAAEGHFGVLGTGFNVDMSQHLFAADWIATQVGPAPELIGQGYPVGPHSLAVAGADLGGGLALGFSGITIAVPILVALTTLAALEHLPVGRATVGALLVALPYLIASYLAQGSFKELFLAAFLVGVVCWALAVRRDGLGGIAAAAPAAVLAAGAIYAYSAPGLAWIAGPLAAWLGIALLERRAAATAAVRAAAMPIVVALAVLAALAAPEAGRIAEFGANAGSVATAAQPDRGSPGAARGGESPGDRGRGGATAQIEDDSEGLDLFDDALGNLFGHISPLEALGVWPSGDFRVSPGDGAVPAPAFYLGALLGALLLALALRRSLRTAGEPLAAALLAAAAIWAAARFAGTPYTAAKALAMIAPLVSLLIARELLGRPRSWAPGGARGDSALAAALAAYLVAALVSSALALANAPVGPERYSAGIGKLRDDLREQPVLMLAPAGQVADRHGHAYYGWELRGARPICVEPLPEEGHFDRPAPAGIRWVLTLAGDRETPFADAREVERRRRITLWEVEGYEAGAPPVRIDPDVPTRCELGLG
jgi:hypothetical protein